MPVKVAAFNVQLDNMGNRLCNGLIWTMCYVLCAVLLCAVMCLGWLEFKFLTIPKNLMNDIDTGFWVGLGWVGLGWFGLVWVGLVWVGLVWFFAV